MRNLTHKRREQRQRAAARAVCESKLSFPHERAAWAKAERVWNEIGVHQEPYICPVCLQFHLKTVKDNA